jgi:hypothetical protein
MGIPAVFGALNNIEGNERITTVEVTDGRRGRSRAISVMTEFGEVQLCRNRWMKKSNAAQDANAFGFSRENFVRRMFQPLILEKLGKTNDTDKFMMVTELGFEVKGQSHMAKWTGLNTAAAQPAFLT